MTMNTSYGRRAPVKCAPRQHRERGHQNHAEQELFVESGAKRYHEPRRAIERLHGCHTRGTEYTEHSRGDRTHDDAEHERQHDRFHAHAEENAGPHRVQAAVRLEIATHEPDAHADQHDLEYQRPVSSRHQ
jgi:hypothetical protein